MSLCHDDIKVYISPISLAKTPVRQQASSWIQASRLFFPSPRFFRVIRLNCLLLPRVPVGKDDACNKMEKDWGEVWDWHLHKQGW